MGLAIGVDIGGTKVAAGVVDADGRILARLRRDTPAQDPAKIEDVIADCIRELAADHEVEAAGLGAAGFVDAARSTVLFAPNLAWRNEPLRAAIEQRTGLPVVVENDANAAAWAETRFGAGHGQPFTVILTVGTGLGGGVVLGGELHPRRVRGGRRGRPHDPGARRTAVRVRQPRLLGAVRQRPRPGQRGPRAGRPVPESARPAARARRRAAGSITGPDGDHGAPSPATRSPSSPSGPSAPGSAMAWPTSPRSSTRGSFIIGGGVSEAGELLVGPARETFEAMLTARSHRPTAAVRLAQLGQDAGLIGAADLARM